MTSPDPKRMARMEVPSVPSTLPWLQRPRLLLLNRVIGPWRRRRRHEALPPPLPAQEIARRVFELPISHWTYDFEPGVRHLGPMAQDFAAAFGLGSTNRMIEMVDANGVNLVAIQALHRQVSKMAAEVARLTERVNDLEGVSQGDSLPEP